MTGDPRIDGYDWAGGREAMLRFGPDTGPVVVAALPLFEEANRTRAFMVAILRALAARGIGSVLPDLPGQGESIMRLEAVSLADMQAAFAAAIEVIGRDARPCYSIGIRSGALIDNIVLARRREPNLRPHLRTPGSSIGRNDTAANGRWHLSPQDGPSLLRELSRMRKADGDSGELGAAETPVMVAGNLLSPAMIAELAGSVLGHPDRTLRLSTDPAPADRHVDGPPLWRRSEPGTDVALAEILAADIADWIAACGG